MEEKILRPTFWRFLKFARPYRWISAAAVFFGVLKFSLALSLPAALKYVFDHILLTDLADQVKLRRLYLALGALVFAYLARAPVTYLRSYLSAKAGHRTIFDLRVALYRHLQHLSLSYHTGRRAGASVSRLINDLNMAQGILAQGVISVGMDLCFLLGTATFLLIYDWKLASASLVLMPFYGYVFKKLNPRLRDVSREVQEHMEDMSGEVTEKISGIQIVFSFVREKTEELSFFRRHRRFLDKILERVRLRMFLTTVAEFFTNFGPLVVIGYGGYRVIVTETLLPGDLLLFQGFIMHLYLPVRRLADYSAVLYEKLAAVDRVFEVLDDEPDIRDKAGAQRLATCEGRIEFDNAHFAYYEGEPVLQGIDFTAEPGMSVALVGRSGAGKSTMVNLVPRFYDVTEGAVRVDGHDVRDLKVRSLRSHIGIVPQDSILFSGTVRENILYGRRDATDEEVRRAAEMAHVDSFVSELEHGYESAIGERGLTLSGGQKQRLSIARAFLRDPRILILDEATSNLDSGSEAIIQDALRELMKGRTTLVIAHRLSTIVDCDVVLVLDEGRLAQSGPHAELVAEGGPYRQFCIEQFGALDVEALQKMAG